MAGEIEPLQGTLEGWIEHGLLCRGDVEGGDAATGCGEEKRGSALETAELGNSWLPERAHETVQIGGLVQLQSRKALVERIRRVEPVDVFETADHAHVDWALLVEGRLGADEVGANRYDTRPDLPVFERCVQQPSSHGGPCKSACAPSSEALDRRHRAARAMPRG